MNNVTISNFYELLDTVGIQCPLKLQSGDALEFLYVLYVELHHDKVEVFLFSRKFRVVNCPWRAGEKSLTMGLNG